MPLKHLITSHRPAPLSIVESEEVCPGVVLDFNADNQVVGVEILHLSKRAPGLEAGKLVFETAPAVATR